MSVVIVDTGCANLASVGFAFDRLGIANTITADAKTIISAERIIVPGVGSAPFAMAQLSKRGLVDVLKSLTQPVMGICLGMQLLFESSEEGSIKGLGLMDENITKLNTGKLPSPHMGWNTLSSVKNDPLLKDVRDGDYVYFVHSYAAPIGPYTLASSAHGSSFSAVIRKDNIYGCQFHPERSGKTGAKILDNFARLRT